jgi:hypothetical protein
VFTNKRKASGSTPPHQPLASAARFRCSASRPARHTWQLLSSAQGRLAGSEEGVPCDGGMRGLVVVVVEGGHAPQFRVTAPGVHTLSEMSANGLVLRFAVNEFVQKLAQSTVWARNLCKSAPLWTRFWSISRLWTRGTASWRTFCQSQT